MVAKLVAEEGILHGVVLWLDVGDEWLVGRDPDQADLVLEDPKVSRRHARLRRGDEGVTIENLSGTNLLLVNEGEIREPTLLGEGDQITLGDTLFRFTTSEEGESAFEAPGGEIDEEEPYDTIFGTPPPAGAPEPQVHLTPSGRWLLKVVSGPNTGAELGLEARHSYTLGTDPDSCDVVFQDLSVSRQHARIDVSEKEELTIEDLHSRNGVVVDGEQIAERVALTSNCVITLGTTSVVIIDREAAQETIVAAAPTPEPERPPVVEEPFPAAAIAEKRKPILAGGTLLLLLIGLAVVAVVVTGTFSLFKTDEVRVVDQDFTKEIQKQLDEFPDVRFTYNKESRKLFLLGHVLTPVDKSEMLYHLGNLNFIGSIEDNVVVDQYIWEETNTIIAKNPQWQGVSMHAPRPGFYVLSGYLKTSAQANSLNDYLRINFPYIDRLDNQVVVEELLGEQVLSILVGSGFVAVTPTLEDGALILKGVIKEADLGQWNRAVRQLSDLRGVRRVDDLVTALSADQAVVDLSDRYKVSGYSSRDGEVFTVLIDGQILGRGDIFQGMEVARITQDAVFLEKEGVKYKIHYTQQ
jgi:type III secretion system YscD/HrpQ family protein